MYEPAKITDALGWPVVAAETDYSWSSISKERVGTERKSISDFCSSMASGRLSDQLRRLVVATEVANLLYEGPLTTNAKGFITTSYWSTRRVKGQLKKVRKTRVLGWKLSSFIPALYGYARLFNVNLIYSPSIEHTASIIRYLYEWDQKTSHSSASSPVRRKVHITSEATIALGVLVGPHCADLLMKEYGNMVGVIENRAEIVKVKGIGPVTAKKFDMVVNEMYHNE